MLFIGESGMIKTLCETRLDIFVGIIQFLVV